MNGQILLALGAMFLLSLLILNTNQNSFDTEDVMYDTKFGILANSLGASIIEDASKKHFDNISDTAFISSLNDLTAAANLGPDLGETPNDPNTFNDVDDYNNYTTVDSSMPSAVFHIETNVSYVNPSNPNIPVSTKQWHKLITVKIWSPSMQDTIKQSSIFSYWLFN